MQPELLKQWDSRIWCFTTFASLCICFYWYFYMTFLTGSLYSFLHFMYRGPLHLKQCSCKLGIFLYLIKCCLLILCWKKICCLVKTSSLFLNKYFGHAWNCKCIFLTVTSYWEGGILRVKAKQKVLTDREWRSR